MYIILYTKALNCAAPCFEKHWYRSPRKARMRNECNVDKPSYDARTMLLSRLKLIDVFPRLMKLLTSVLWFIDNKLLKIERFFFCILSTTKGMKWHKYHHYSNASWRNFIKLSLISETWRTNIPLTSCSSCFRKLNIKHSH